MEVIRMPKIITTEERLKKCYFCKQKVFMCVEDKEDVKRIFCPLCRKDDEIVLKSRKVVL